MSDDLYRQQSARRARMIGLILGGLALVACAVLGVINLYRDDCTGGFDRAPQAVVRSFIEAISRGDGEAVRRCWQPQAFFSLEAGCSEICLSRVLGIDYRIQQIEVGNPSITNEGRARLTVRVVLSCPEGEARYEGEVLLDGIAQELPWRHWKIIHSTVGGALASPWCQ